MMKKMKKMFNEVRMLVYKNHYIYAAMLIMGYAYLAERALTLFDDIEGGIFPNEGYGLVEFILCIGMGIMIKSFYERKQKFSRKYGSYKKVMVVDENENEDDEKEVQKMEYKRISLGFTAEQ